MNSRHEQFYSNVIWQYGLQIVKYIFPLITLPYLTRVLLPEGYAVYAYVVSFMTFAQTFVDFGFNLSGTKRIAGASTVEEENRAIGAVTEARLLLGSAAGVVVALIAWFIPITHDNMLYTILAFLAVFGKAIAPDFLFQGHENMGPLTTRYLVSKGVSTALTFVVVRSMDDLLWIPILDILSSAIALIWSFVSARRTFGTTIALVPFHEAYSELKDSALYCFSNMASVVFSGFTTLLIGIVITDKSMISYWSLAVTAVNAIQSLYAPITNSLYPHMVKGGDYGFARKLLLISVPILLIGTIAFASLSDLVMLVLGGKEYLAGSWVIAWASPILLFSFYATMIGWPILGASGRVAEVTYTTVGSAIFCVASLLLVSATGYASMRCICIIRCLTEAILCFSRLWLARSYLFAGVVCTSDNQSKE